MGLDQRLSDHQLNHVVDVDGVVEQGLLVLQLLTSEEETLTRKVNVHPFREGSESTFNRWSLSYLSFTFVFNSSIVAVLLIITIASPPPAIFFTFTYIFKTSMPLVSAYLQLYDDSMCINMKLGCKFCVNQVALDQRHFDIHDFITAME